MHRKREQSLSAGSVVPGFDRVVAIDWSGARAVRTPAIAVALVESGPDPVVRLVRPADGGHWSRQAVADWLRQLLDLPGRTLVGIDCNLGYAASVMRAQFPGIRHAAALWAEVDRCSWPAVNFLAEGYWMHPSVAPLFWCSGRRPPGWKGPRRSTEQACIDIGLGTPESPFKLLGPKQVGKGGLAGMRMLHALRTDLGDRLAVWPFDGVDRQRSRLVVTEIFPRLFIRRAGGGTAKIRDSGVLRTMLQGCRIDWELAVEGPIDDHAADALLAAAGIWVHCREEPDALVVPTALAPTLALEGWIFGVPLRTRCRDRSTTGD